MSVGSAVPDIPIIDVNTGEETTLKAVIGNGECRPVRFLCGVRGVVW
jgi:hypothetical protein